MLSWHGAPASIKTGSMWSISRSAPRISVIAFLPRFIKSSRSDSPTMAIAPVNPRRTSLPSGVITGRPPIDLSVSSIHDCQMEPHLLYWLLALALVVTGLAGLILPAIPGAPLLFAAALLAAWAENFEYVGIRTLVILAVLALLLYGVDLLARLFAAKRFGASKRGMIRALIGDVD